MALDDLLDEHEQSERVRDWLRQNALGMITGVALGLGAIVGWQWWQKHQASAQVQAAERYEAAIKTLEAGNLARATTQLRSLDKDGMYSALARLHLARAQLQAGQRDPAIATLRSLQTNDPALRAVRDERLARLLIDAGKPAEALALVQTATQATALEVRGDAQLALKQVEQARDSYARALARTEVGAPQQRLLELKLTDAGGTPATSEDIR